MMETAAIEAIRATGGVQQMREIQPASVADPGAVSAFSNAWGVSDAADVPFAQQVQAAWGTTQVQFNEQLHRMTSLTDYAIAQSASLAGLTQLQYETATAGFRLEVTTAVAKKASDAVSTLVKNG